MQLFINNWSAVLTAPATASAVSLSVPLADAAKLTGLGGGDHYLLTLAELDGNGVETAWEIVKVTGSASGVLTVLRDQEGTGARDWAAAAVISARVTKGALEALRAGTGTAVGDDVPRALGVASPGASAAASRQDHVHAKPTAADIGAATTAQGAKADTAVQPAALASGLAGKVDKDGTKVLTDQNYTSAEKAKLAGLEGAHFKGLHASLASLQAAHPSAVAGDYADVDSGVGADVARYIWDVSDSTWLIQSGASGSMTAAQIKAAYESNPDTNAFSDTEQAKLAAIAASATANATDAELRDRSTHTGTQVASTISDFAATVRATVLTGLSLANAAAGTATDTVLVFLGKLQAQITGKQDALVSGTTLRTVNGISLLGAGDIALEKYRGLYVSLAALNAAVPTASAGDYADVDSGSGSNVKRYIWDASDTAWVEQTGGGAGMTNPMTTSGDLIVGGAAGVPARLPVGATGKVLGVTGGAPAWVDPPASGTSLPVVRTITSNETLGLSAVNSHTRSTAATNIDITIPPQASVAWADNTEMRFEQGAAGPITFLPGAGVTIEKKPGAVLKTPYRNCLLTLKRTATNVWSLLGELALVNTTCAVRSTEYAAVASGVTSIVVNKPAGTVDGDIMVMFVQGQGNGTLASTGWTSRTSVGWVGGCSAILTKTASSEPASWTVTQTNSGVLNVRVVTVSGATAVDLNSTLPAPNSANPRTIASINPASDGLLLAGFFNTSGGATVTSSPPTMAIVGVRITAGYSEVVVYSEKVPAGATGTRVLSWSSPSGSTEAMIVLR